MTTKLRSRTAKGRSLKRVVGELGSFRDARGRVLPCRITHVYKDGILLRVAYWNREAGRVIPAAWIGTKSFIPDKLSNAEVSDRRAHAPENITGANGGSIH